MDYNHKHFLKVFTVKKEFVPDPELSNPDEYLGIDMAYLFCSGCGEVVKKKVTDKTNVEGE